MTKGLIVSQLSHSYGAKKALNAVSFSAEAGKFTALLGPNGAGKSTLFGLLTRLFVATEGEIEVAGHGLADAPRKALAEIGVVFQQTTLDLDLSVLQNLRYFAALHGLSGSDAATRIDQVLDQLDMSERRHERARDLNGGHKRRTEIARSLLHNPSVLLLDEATVGLDAAARRSITRHVHDLTTERNLTVLWATHLVDEVYDDDDLIILHRGEVLSKGRALDVANGMDLSDRFLMMTGSAL